MWEGRGERGDEDTIRDWNLETKTLSSGSRIGTKGVGVAVHAGVLHVLLAVEVSAKDLEGFLVYVLVVVVLEVVYLLYSISLLDVCGVDVNPILIACIFLANLQYLSVCHSTFECVNMRV